MDKLFIEVEKMYCSCKYTFGEILKKMSELGYSKEEITKALNDVQNKYEKSTNEYV